MKEDELEILKAGTEGAIAGAFRPVHELLSKLAGPAAEEAGLAWRDHVRVWRLSRAIRLAKKVELILEHSKIPLHAVPLKALLPAFEHATLEDNDRLQDRWAALLANAATNTEKTFYSQTPVFVEILKQLNLADVLFLDRLRQDIAGPRTDLGNPSTMSNVYFGAIRDLTGGDDDIDEDAFRVTLSNVVRLGVLRAARKTVQDGFLSLSDDLGEATENRYYFTEFGWDFLKACTAPYEQSDST